MCYFHYIHFRYTFKIPGVHEAAPGCSASEQLLQAVAPVCVALNLPAGQAVQAEEPGALAYVPAGQG